MNKKRDFNEFKDFDIGLYFAWALAIMAGYLLICVIVMHW